jgi:hypothetical protein
MPGGGTARWAVLNLDEAMAGHHTDHRNMGTEIDAYQKSRHHDKAVADVR